MARLCSLILGAALLTTSPALADVCSFGSSNPLTPASLLTAMNDSSCEVIELPPGTYDLGVWNFPFFTHPLTLRGSGRTALVVNSSSPGGTTTPARSYRFMHTNSDLTLENLELRNFSNGIKVQPDAGTVSEVVLRNVTFVNMGQGLFSQGPNGNLDTGLSRFEVRDSTFRGVDRPIDVNTATLQDVRIEDNRFTDVASIAVALGNAAYDPDERRSKIVVRGNFIEHVDGAADLAVKPFRSGVFLHGNFCFVQDNYIREVPSPAGGWSAGIYTKCMYSKVTENTIFDAGGAFEDQNGAITIKGKERDETTGAFGFGALVSGNHIIFRDTSATHRVGVKVHAGYAYVTDNVVENATFATQVVGVANVTIDDEETSDPSVQDDDGNIEWTALLP